jgi:DNA-binding LytR/AlgR family response regulator
LPNPTAIIAEDEPILRQELREELSTLWPELEVCAEAADGTEALHAIQETSPEIAFLDVEMPGMTGVEVAQAVNGRCHVVFVTAYDKYAVAAFEQQAADYILKPYSRERLAASVKRLRERLQGVPAKLDGILEALAKHAPEQTSYLRWITASHGQKVRFVTVDKVCYFQADNKYTMVMTADSELLIRRPIKELHDSLDPQTFRQIHRSTIVNVNAIAEVSRDVRGLPVLHLKQRPETLAVSQPFAHLFRQM